MHDAKQRYRDWTGGGFRVHATIDTGETERDLFLLLLGRLPADFAGVPSVPWDSDPLPWPRELIGARGWESVDQMLTALEVTRGYVQLEERPALRLLVGHKARTEQVIAGSSRVQLELHEPGDGDLDPDWQRALLRERIRDPRGRWVPTPHHRAMTALYRAVAHTSEMPRRLELELDDEAVASLPPGDLTDPAYARALVDDFLQENDFIYTVPKNPRVALNPELLGRRARLERGASARVPRLLRLAKRIERRLRG